MLGSQFNCKKQLDFSGSQEIIYFVIARHIVRYHSPHPVDYLKSIALPHSVSLERAQRNVATGNNYLICMYICVVNNCMPGMNAETVGTQLLRLPGNDVSVFSMYCMVGNFHMTSRTRTG